MKSPATYVECDIERIERDFLAGPGEAQWSEQRDAVYDALIDAGKCWTVGDVPNDGRGWREALEPVVRSYLDHPSEDLREGALRTLTVYWALDGYRDAALAMGRADPDPGVRATALDGLAAYARLGADPELTAELAGKLRDPLQPPLVRTAAYRALLAASGYLASIPPRRRPDLLDVFDDVDGRVDWSLVDRLVRSAGASVA